MYWTDPRLAWNPEDFGGIDTIRINAKNIWIPDITSYNAISGTKPSKFMISFEELSNAVVRSTGFVVFTPQIGYEVRYRYSDPKFDLDYDLTFLDTLRCQLRWLAME